MSDRCIPCTQAAKPRRKQQGVFVDAAHFPASNAAP